MKTLKDERGAALLVALLMLMGLAFIGAALVTTTSVDLKIAGEERRGTQAEFVAEAGVQEVLHRLGLTPGENVTVNGETFDPSIRDPVFPPDPSWEARIYVPGDADPVSAGSLQYTPTVQPADGLLDYVREDRFLTIRHKWIDRNNDGIRDANELVRYDAGRFPPENFDRGSTIEVVNVQGFRAESRRRLQVEATRFPFSPNVLAALCSDNSVDVTGNVAICGHDHLATTPTNTNLQFGPCSPNWDQDSGHRPAITTTGDDIDRGGSSDLLGDPAATDTSTTNPFYSLAECLGVTQDVIDQILSNPDHTDGEAEPLEGIVYIQDDVHLTDTTGEGLLYVTGDLQVSGTFVWRGLVYVEGDFMITGTPWILGGVMVRGRSEVAFAGGNPTVLYSSEMLRLALEAAFKYVVISWKEL